MSLLSPDRVVLRTPHACGAFVTSLVGRLCYGIVGLSLLLTLTAGGRDYGFAGFVMALFGLTIVLVAPFRAWMVDRHGPRRSLHSGGLRRHRHCYRGDPGPLRRERCRDRRPGRCGRCLRASAGDDRDVLQTAYSLDGVVEELLNVAGPVIAGMIVVTTTPAVGLLVTAGLVLAGTELFVRLPTSCSLALLIVLAGVLVSRPWPPPTSSATAWHRRRHGTVPGTGSTAATAQAPRPGRCCPGSWSGGFR